MNLTESFLLLEPTEAMVTRRVTLEPALAVVLIVTLAVMRTAPPAANEALLYVPATTLAVMSFVQA